MSKSASLEWWFYEQDGKQQGGVTVDEIMTLIQSGKLSKASRVWTTGMESWLPIQDTKLSQHLQNDLDDKPDLLRSPELPPALDDIPPPLQSPGNETKALLESMTFWQRLKGIWSLIYAPAGGSIVTYAVCLYIGVNQYYALDLWSSAPFVAMSWGIVFLAWAEDWWRFKKSDQYTGWSWWWLFLPCYIHARMDKQWKLTLSMLVLSTVMSVVVSTLIALHGSGQFWDEYVTEQQDDILNKDINSQWSQEDIAALTNKLVKQSPSRSTSNQTLTAQIVADYLQRQVDRDYSKAYGGDYHPGDSQVQVEQLGTYLFKTHDSWTCGNGSCSYTYYGGSEDGMICDLGVDNDAQALKTTQCVSEFIRIQ